MRSYESLHGTSNEIKKKKGKKNEKKRGRGKCSQTRTKQAFLHNSEQQMAIIVLTVTHNGITLRVRGKKSLAVEFTTPEEEERQHRRQLPHTATSHQSGTHPFALSPAGNVRQRAMDINKQAE